MIQYRYYPINEVRKLNGFKLLNFDYIKGLIDLIEDIINSKNHTLTQNEWQLLTDVCTERIKALIYKLVPENLYFKMVCYLYSLLYKIKVDTETKTFYFYNKSDLEMTYYSQNQDEKYKELYIKFNFEANVENPTKPGNIEEEKEKIQVNIINNQQKSDNEIDEIYNCIDVIRERLKIYMLPKLNEYNYCIEKDYRLTIKKYNYIEIILLTDLARLYDSNEVYDKRTHKMISNKNLDIASFNASYENIESIINLNKNGYFHINKHIIELCNEALKDYKIKTEYYQKKKKIIIQVDPNTEEIIAIFSSIKNIIELYPDYTKSGLSNCIKGRKNKYKGYFWREEEQ